MMPNSCKVSFITVTYNGLADTIALLDSIYTADFSFYFEIVVVDNASREDEFGALQQLYPAIKGCRSATNLGFAGGNNLGIARASGAYFYFLNNDTLLPYGADQQIDAMLAFLDSRPQAGGLSPKIKYFEPSDLLQFAGCTPLSRITLRNRQIGYQEQDSGQYDTTVQIPYMHGAAMLIPRRVVEDIGVMPELYFLYYEELDWSCQITQKYRLYYFAQASILHKESASTGLDSPLKTYYLTRNRMLFAYRNRRGCSRVGSLIYLILVANAKSLLQYSSRRQWGQAKSVWTGVRDAFRFFTSKSATL